MAFVSTATMPFSRFQLPGLNLPLNWTPHKAHSRSKYTNGELVSTEFPAQGEGKDLFPTALSEADIADGRLSLPLTSLRELTMVRIMNALTDKVGWEVKVFDEAVAEKWKAEAMATPNADVTQKMADWIIEELRYKAQIFKNTGAVTVFDANVVKSDCAIPDSTKEQLRAAVKPFEDIPKVYKDYHPGSDGQVVDLVHPSLFPLIYGRSRVLKNCVASLENCIQSCGKGNVIAFRPDEEMKLDRKGSSPDFGAWRDETTSSPYGKRFQWLPCDVDISSRNGNAKITSYINNLHPHKHEVLYSIIEDVITRTLPLWNMTLTPLRTPKLSFNGRIDFTLEFDPDPENMSESEGPQQGEDEDEDDFWDRRNEWEEDIRKAVQPEPDEFTPPHFADGTHLADIYGPDAKDLSHTYDAVDLKRDYGHRGLQIIVKLANIELTPENPFYAGGSWHVEGQLNEHICATALYYYDNQNIADSHLAFRQQSSTDAAQEVHYPQNVHGWLSEIFGCENEGSSVQEVGSVLCSEGRLLTFPNILQHQVQPFGLADTTKPGHRKILALFLVDPNIRIISTANVPPQQRHWWSEEVLKGFESREAALGKLSAELKEKVFEEVDDFPIGMDEAKELRLELMEERTQYVAEQSTMFEEVTFSLCEH